jgi:nucleotide-binding universal stress UspA family protein
MSVPAVRRIVVGVDGSGDSVSALKWACREARIRGTEVHAVHVWEAPLHSPASYAVPAPGNHYDEATDDTQLWKATLADVAPGVRIRTETAVGLVARVLLDRCMGADMLVLGTASDVPDQLWSAGPVIRACLRRAPCPVVVISADQEGVWGRETALDVTVAPAQRDAPTVSGAGIGSGIAAAAAGVGAHGVGAHKDEPVSIGA